MRSLPIGNSEDMSPVVVSVTIGVLDGAACPSPWAGGERDPPRGISISSAFPARECSSPNVFRWDVGAGIEDCRNALPRGAWRLIDGSLLEPRGSGCAIGIMGAGSGIWEARGATGVPLSTSKLAKGSLDGEGNAGTVNVGSCTGEVVITTGCPDASCGSSMGSCMCRGGIAAERYRSCPDEGGRVDGAMRSSLRDMKGSTGGGLLSERRHRLRGAEGGEDGSVWS